MKRSYFYMCTYLKRFTNTIKYNYERVFNYGCVRVYMYNLAISVCIISYSAISLKVSRAYTCLWIDGWIWLSIICASHIYEHIPA